MVKKRLSDLLQEEAKKSSPPEGESVIEVVAEEIIEKESATEDNTLPKTPEQAATKRTNSTKADLEATVKELQEALEKAHTKEAAIQEQIADLKSAFSGEEAIKEQLKKELGEAKKLESALSEKTALAKQLKKELDEAKKLESALSEETALVERFKKELYEAKKAALHLAEANSKLMEENNSLKQEKENLKPKPITYKKSYRMPEKLPPKPIENPVDTDSQMWLLD